MAMRRGPRGGVVDYGSAAVTARATGGRGERQVAAVSAAVTARATVGRGERRVAAVSAAVVAVGCGGSGHPYGASADMKKKPRKAAGMRQMPLRPPFFSFCDGYIIRALCSNSVKRCSVLSGLCT